MKNSPQPKSFSKPALVAVAAVTAMACVLCAPEVFAMDGANVNAGMKTAVTGLEATLQGPWMRAGAVVGLFVGGVMSYMQASLIPVIMAFGTGLMVFLGQGWAGSTFSMLV